MSPSGSIGRRIARRLRRAVRGVRTTVTPTETERLLALRAVLEREQAGLDASARQEWLADVLGRRLGRALRWVPRGDDEHWGAVRETVAPLAAEADDAWPLARLHPRLLAFLAAHGTRADVEAALVDREENGPSFDTVVADSGALLAVPGYLPLLSLTVPDALLTAHPADLPLVARVDRAVRHDDGAWTVWGHAYVRHVDAVRHPATITAAVVDGASRREVGVTRHDDPTIDHDSRDRFTAYAPCAIELEVPAGAQGDLELTVEVAGVRRVGPFGSRQSSGAAYRLPDGSRWDDERGLVLDAVAVAVPPPAGPQVQVVDVDTQALVVHLDVPSEGLALSTATDALVASVDGSAVGFALATTKHGVTVPVPPRGTYRLTSRGAPVLPSDALLETLPRDHALGVADVRLGCDPDDGALTVQVRAALAADERGRLAQRALHARIPTLVTEPLLDAVVLSSFSGRSGGDSPRQVLAELQRRLPDLPAYWGVRDLSVAVPDGAEPVVMHTRRWYELLHRARYVVTSSNLPYYYRKHPGQTYLQTWHGTPLKRIGEEVPATAMSLSYRALMRREAGWWDVLLAQSDVAADLLHRSFPLASRIEVTGYPRNDALAAPGATRRRAEVRRELGLPDGARAVLYAPTWRDDAAKADGGVSFVSSLDLDAFRTGTPDDTWLLVRAHSNAVAGRTGDGERMLDVSAHPDVTDLLLVADVLVTDYSSVLFDFASTRRPLALLAPDLAHYRDSTRGFFLDPAKVVPGPLLATTDELLGWLAGGPPTAEGVDEFALTFASHDDGGAAARAVDLLLEGPAGIRG